jgi:hypothetical protein
MADALKSRFLFYRKAANFLGGWGGGGCFAVFEQKVTKDAKAGEVVVDGVFELPPRSRSNAKRLKKGMCPSHAAGILPVFSPQFSASCCKSNILGCVGVPISTCAGAIAKLSPLA